jgi:hypothetical protein
VEVTIGVQFGTRELVVETDQEVEEITQQLEAVLTKGGIFSLTDTKGRRVLVPVDKLAYVEFEPDLERHVGFGRI